MDETIGIHHTQEIKKTYSPLERQIKRAATEYQLLSDLGTEKCAPFTWFSITDDFKLRPLSLSENSQYLSNVSTIKRPTLTNTTQWIRSNLLELVDQDVPDPEISEQYKRWINDFFSLQFGKNLSALLKLSQKCPKCYKYLEQTKNISDIKEKNICQQLAKILNNKFWEEAFDIITIEETKKDEKWNTVIESSEKSILSQKSLNYIFTIFLNANKVWESWWKRIDQVFHDWDFPFITENIMANEDEYIKVLIYLIDKSKNNYYWDGWEDWQKEWSKKTSQYADILRALTDKQLMLDKLPNLWSEDSAFLWDSITQNLAKKNEELLTWVVDVQNERSWNEKMILDKRLKSLSSCVEKIIEWKKINDVIWFRISIRWIGNHNFNDIVNVSKNWFESLSANIKKHAEEYVKPWQTISIKWISVDNKWVFNLDQINEIVSLLNSIASAKQREKTAVSYIDKSKRIEKMKQYYPEVVSDENLWDVVQSFYDRITWWKVRWRNWWYKDFKYNIIFEIKDEKWNSIWERTMEVQFDDINNWKWMSNYNIRNFERRLNTQSRLSFSVSLWEARKNCEINLKKMCVRANKWTKDLSEEEKKSFFEIPFDDGPIDIHWFEIRTEENSDLMDKAIVNIINYFLQKWTFILCYDENKFDVWEKLKNWLLTVEDLYDTEFMENLRICSSLELASQQHSYLQQDRDRKVGIYISEKHKIWWISLWELIDPMNLWKKKDKKYSQEA